MYGFFSFFFSFFFFLIASKNGFSSYSAGTLSGLYLYPIKSCAALKITKGSWPLSKTSLKYDRQFAIMQGKSTLTQKNESLLSQIQPEIDLKQEIMILSAPWQTSTCRLSLNRFSARSGSMALCSGKVCGDIIEAHDCGDEVGDWLEDTLGEIIEG